MSRRQLRRVLRQARKSLRRDVDHATMIVFRPAPGVPDGWLPERFDGVWFDRSAIQTGGYPGVDETLTAIAKATGRFEVREDGMVAEVYEVAPRV